MRALRSILLLALLLSSVPAPAAIRLPSIKNGLIELALSQISTPGSFEVTAETITDSGDGATSLLDVRVSDGEGVWLTVERLSFTWEPRRILAGELSITRLELIGVDVSRPPAAGSELPELKPQQPWSKGLFDWPRAPISVSVEGVRLERVSFADGVLPQPIRFDALGRARDRGSRQEIELSLDRTDGIEGRIALAMHRDFAANTIRLSVDASEAPGGMVAAAAGLKSDAPAHLSLLADGPPEDWKVTLDAGVGEVFDAAGAATLSYAGRLAVAADFAITPGPDMGPAARAALGERATLTANLIEGVDGQLSISAAELASPSLQIAASGAYALGSGESDLAVKLVALPPLAALIEAGTFERLTFDGRLTGARGALAADGSLGLSRLATAPVDAALLTFDGRLAQTVRGLSFDLAGRGEALRIDRIGPGAIGPARLAFAGTLDGDLLSATRAALESRLLTVEASGDYDLAGKTGSATVRLDAPDIGPVAAAYGAAAAGAVTAAADLTLAGAELEAKLSADLRRFAMDRVAAERMAVEGTAARSASTLIVDLAAEGAGLVVDQVPADLTRDVRLALKGSLSGETLALETLKLDTPLVAAQAAGTVNTGSLALAVDYRAGTAGLARVAAAYGVDAGGRLEASGRAEGPPEALRLAGEARLDDAAFDGRDYGVVSLDHDVTLGTEPAGGVSLALRGSWLGDGEAETRFRLQGERLVLEGLTAGLLGVTVAGDVAADLDASLVEGAVDVAAGDLRQIGQFAGMPVSGRLAGRVSLDAPHGRQDGSATLHLSKVVAGEAEVETADLHLDAADLAGSPRIGARLKAQGVALAGIALAELEATASGPLAAIELSAGASGELGRKPFTAALAGTADAAGVPLRLTLARAEATAGADSARLRRPLAIRIGGGSVEAAGLDLALPDGASLAGDMARLPAGFTGDLQLSGIQLSILDRWEIAEVMGGTLDGEVSFDTRRATARADASLRVRHLGFQKTQIALGGLDLDADAEWDGRRLATAAELRGDFGEPARLRLALPIIPGNGGVPALQRHGPLDGAVDWSGDIGDLWALVPAIGHVLDGRTEIDLRVAGTMDAPQVDGGIRVVDGQYQNVDVGTILTGLDISTMIDRNGPIRVALDAADGAEGKVSADAELRLRGTPSVDLKATVERATLVRRDDLRAKVSGRLTLVGPFTDLAAQGDFVVDRAEVRLVGGAPPELVELDGVRIKGAPEDDADARDRRSVTLDIRISAPGKIFVRGRGLDSEWKMDLAVTGDAIEPVVKGEIERIRGVLDLIGRPFDLKRGRLIFDGGRKIDPIIDVSLEAEANGVRGGMVVEGRASDPDIRFASVPALPEEEVLPRLLFDRSRQSLSGPEAIQLAAGVATLMSGRAGPLDALRETVGLDVLRLEGTGADDASVTVGRNVADRVFVGAKQGLGERGTTLTVEVEVIEDVTADTEITPDGSSSFGLTYRRDF